MSPIGANGGSLLQWGCPASEVNDGRNPENLTTSIRSRCRHHLKDGIVYCGTINRKSTKSRNGASLSAANLKRCQPSTAFVNVNATR